MKNVISSPPVRITQLVPFMELLLPLLLAVFPDLLPSTFDDPKQRQAQQQCRLQAQALMAEYLKQGLQEVASSSSSSSSMPELAVLLQKVRSSSHAPAVMPRLAC